MPTVVWCTKCETAVWAADDLTAPISRYMNIINMICPECGQVATFDGWFGEYSSVSVAMFHTDEHRVYDGWSLLKAAFACFCRNGVWAISPNSDWFQRPDQDNTEYVSNLLKRRRGCA